MITKKHALISNGIILADTKLENLLRDNAFRAMDQYAKAVALDFQIWAEASDYYREDDGKWYGLPSPIAEGGTFTEDQIFTKYLEATHESK